MIFWFIPSQEAKAKCPEKVANKWNWVLEALWVSVPLLGSIKVTFALNDEPLAAIFDEIRDFQAHSEPETRGQRSRNGGK